MLCERRLKRLQLLLRRAPADRNDLTAPRPAERKRTFSDHDVARVVGQLKPNQAVASERRDCAQAPAKGSAKVVVIERDRRNERELLSVTRSHPNTHCACDRYLLVKEFFDFTELL